MASPEANEPKAPAAPPLFESTGGRIVLGGASLLDLGEHAARGQGLAIAFEHAALVRLLVGQAELEGGQVRFFGRTPHEALSSGKLGLGLATLEWDPDFTVETALVTSASLVGTSKGPALRTLRRLRLEPRRNTRLDKLTLLERRLLTLAAALVTEPDVVLLERPFSTLDDNAAQLFETVLADELATRRWIALVDLGGPWERRLCARADAGVLVARAGRLLGPFEAEPWLEETDVFWVRAGGVDTAWHASLREAGGAVSLGPAPGTLLVRGLTGRRIATLTSRAGVALHELAPLGYGVGGHGAPGGSESAPDAERIRA